MKYKKGYKYQLVEDKKFSTGIPLMESVSEPFLEMTTDGILLIKYGYAWDGPSGFTWDTKTFMEGSLIHDALYQLMRLKKVPLRFRERADQILVEVCKEKGMNRVRRKYVYWAVRTFGVPSATKPRKTYDI